MTGDRRTPPAAPATIRAGLVESRPGERAERIDGAATGRHAKTSACQLADPTTPPDEDYWQRVIDRATD